MMRFLAETHERAVTAAANTGIFGGAGTAVGGWLTGQNVAAWGGLIIGAIGLIVNWHHKRALRQIERERLAMDRQRFLGE